VLQLNIFFLQVMGGIDTRGRNTREASEGGHRPVPTSRLQRTSVQDIAQLKAEVPKGSFYNYFKSKEERRSRHRIFYPLSALNSWSWKITSSPSCPAFANTFRLTLERNCSATVYVRGCLVGNFAAEIHERDTSTSKKARHGSLSGRSPLVASRFVLFASTTRLVN